MYNKNFSGEEHPISPPHQCEGGVQVPKLNYLGYLELIAYTLAETPWDSVDLLEGDSFDAFISNWLNVIVHILVLNQLLATCNAFHSFHFWLTVAVWTSVFTVFSLLCVFTNCVQKVL